MRDLKRRRTLELQELAGLTGWDVSRYDSYLNRVQGYFQEEEIIPEPLPGKPVQIHPLPKPEMAVVSDTVTESQPVAASGSKDDSGAIDQALFIDESESPVKKADAGDAYLYLAASIMLSTALVLYNNRKKA